MIPAFNHSDVLPPYTGIDPTIRQAVSPYETTLCDIVDRFATSPERIILLAGFLEYRGLLASLGIVVGHQWVSGSFTENVESSRGRPPNDVDVVTVANRPHAASTQSEWRALFHANLSVFDPDINKTLYHCDAYYVDLGKRVDLVVEDTCYWFGLFSHNRDLLWKGMLRVSLQADDTEAKERLRVLRDA